MPPEFKNVNEAINYWKAALCSTDKKILPLLRMRNNIMDRLAYLRRKQREELNEKQNTKNKE